MPKKIYDVIPPKKRVHKEEVAKKDDVKPEKHHKTKRHLHKEKRKFPLKELLVGAGILVIAFGVFLYFKLQKAEILIWPKTETLSFEQKITADESAYSVDSDKKIIPAEYLEEEKEGSKEFPATGNASNEGKAAGTIVVYNKYSPATPITLKSGTHFLSDSGKYFVTLKKITIPAAQTQGGKLVPGSIEVQVEAADSGESYNIDPAKFSVPKLSGTSYYYSVYAESTKAMSGGYAGEVKKVIDDDIQTARDTLTEQLFKEAEDSLKNRTSQDYILLDDAILKTVVDASSSAKSGTVTNTFKENAKVKISAVAFKKSDLEKVAKDYIVSQMPDSKTLLEQSLDMSYTSEMIDIKGGKMVLNVKFSAKIYKNIDKNDLISLFGQKTAGQIEEIINSNLGGYTDKTEINFWPFWVKKSPKDKNKINLELRFE